MKAQSSVEYMAVIGISLLIIIPLAGFVWTQNETATRVRQAEVSANTIAKTAESLYAQGNGAKATVDAIFPAGYDANKSYVRERTVLLRVVTPGGAGDVIARSDANLTGTLPAGPGYRVLTLQLVNGTVNVVSS